ncbi:MAG: dicarboxylate/amino acid:cation symporter [Enterocloster clostridioformis]
MKKKPLALWIFAGLALGIAAGMLLMGRPDIAEIYIKPFGTLFLNLLKFIVVPIVLFSIMNGVISMKDIKKVGSIGGKTVIYYMCTTFLRLPWDFDSESVQKGFPVLSTSSLEYTAAETPSFIQTLIGIFPSNIIQPMAEASMLQVIVVALLFGFGTIVAGKKGEVFGNFVESANNVSIAVMSFIIKLSPIGVFCLITPVVAANGPQILGSLAFVLLVAYIGYILHASLVYSLTVKSLAGIGPLKFFKGMAPAMIMAFSSASSVGALPLNLECTEKLGARKEVASFVLPLGATINMDGTAIYQGVCAVFIASCYGINLTLSQQIVIILTAVLASVGTAGVPGSGMIMLAMVLQSAGLPVEGIALVAGIDRLFDMGRTTVNITGDAACAVIVSYLEDKRLKKA